MAFSVNSKKEIPSDAVIMTEDEYVIFHSKLIDGHEPSSEVWSLKHGHIMLGGIVAATGAYINNYYRSKLKLGNWGKLSTYLPIVVIPTVVSMIGHKGAVTKDIIINPKACSTCLEIRSAFIQSGFGVLYPTLMAPLAAFLFATRYFTYRLPDVTQQPKEVFHIWRKMTKPLVPTITALICFHGICAILITHKELEHFYKLQLKLNDAATLHLEQ